MRRVRFFSVSIVSIMKLIVDTIVGGETVRLKMGRLAAYQVSAIARDD